MNTSSEVRVLIDETVVSHRPLISIISFITPNSLVAVGTILDHSGSLRNRQLQLQVWIQFF